MVLSLLLDRLWQKGQEGIMITRVVSMKSLFRHKAHSWHLMSANWPVGLEPTGIRTKCFTNDWKRALTVAHSKTRQHRTGGRNDESQTEVIFVVMDAFVNVLVGWILIIHCHENIDCHAVVLRASSELSQSVTVNRNAHAFSSQLLTRCVELGCFPSIQQIILRKKNLDTFPQILVHSPRAKVK